MKDVSSIAISKSIAEKYFGDWKKVTGNRINLDNSIHDFQVAAVFEDVPPIIVIFHFQSLPLMPAL